MPHCWKSHVTAQFYSSVTGFLVSSQTIYGSDLGESAVRFAQRKAHHESKQPILVIYTNDGSQRTPNFISPKDQGMNQSYDIQENNHFLPVNIHEKHYT